MRIDILTIFPKAFPCYLGESIIKRARKKGLLKIVIHDIRSFSKDKHRKVDDRPYGGGPGMVLTPQPLYDAIAAVKKKNRGALVIYLTAAGAQFTQGIAKRLAKYRGLILLCGRYEGIDQRVIDLAVDMEISIGPYVLAGGELPALVVIDTLSRFIPGVVGDKASLVEESFSEALEGRREYPHYTRPPVFRGKHVPKILLTGDHKAIAVFRKKHLR